VPRELLVQSVARRPDGHRRRFPAWLRCAVAGFPNLLVCDPRMASRRCDADGAPVRLPANGTRGSAEDACRAAPFVI